MLVPSAVALAGSWTAVSVALVLLAVGSAEARPLSADADVSDPGVRSGAGAATDGDARTPPGAAETPAAQVEPPPEPIVARPRLDARLAAARPFGDWRYHPLASTEHAPDDLVLFGSALGFEVEYTLQWFRGPVAGWSTGMIVQGLYFDTDDWTAHAAANGPPVDASAMLLGVHFLGGYRLFHGRRMSLDMSIGIGGLYPSGSEAVDLDGGSISFDYTFLDIALSTRLALASSVAVGDFVDVVLEVNQISGFSAVDHAGRDADSLFAMGISLGSRFWLGGRP